MLPKIRIARNVQVATVRCSSGNVQSSTVGNTGLFETYWLNIVQIRYSPIMTRGYSTCCQDISSLLNPNSITNETSGR